MKLIYVMILILGLASSIAGYYIDRSVNWKFYYKDLVHDELKPLAVKEALDILESRQREDGLLAEINLLKNRLDQEDYRTDVLTGAINELSGNKK